MSVTIEEFDYVVVGAGSSGCVVANRLSEDPCNRVLLIEAGGSGRSPLISLPFGYAWLLNSPRYDWRHEANLGPALGGRTVSYPHGKVLGGTSSINGMFYVRGLREDYDGWADQGLEGWNWTQLEPYFRRVERYTEASGVARGRDGPVTVSRIPNWHPLSEMILEAAAQSRVGRSADYNGAAPGGLGPAQLFMHEGRRCGSLRAYLTPARHRRNLKIVTNALATAVRFEGIRASGVAYQFNGSARFAAAKLEVVLSAGAISTPHLLELSGVGDAPRLERIGVPCKHHLPAVGEHLQDHVLTFVIQQLDGILGLGREITGWRGVLAAANAVLFRRGYLCGTPTQITGRTTVSIDGRPIPVNFVGSPLRFALDPVRKSIIRHPEPAMMLASFVGRPLSRGSVHARTPSIIDPPTICGNYMTSQRDLAAAGEGVRLCREIIAQAALDAVRGTELSPGANIRSTSELHHFIQSTASPAYHAAGTCRMAENSAQGVVDASLRIHGLEGLRIADASVMPAITSANPHATCLVIGEKAADMILAA